MSSSRFHSFLRFLPFLLVVTLCALANAADVTLVSPSDGAIVNNTSVSFTCSATDANGLSSAALYIGNEPQTLTFSGAAETDDAQISADSPTTNFGSATSINVDGLSPHAHGVIKFLSVFGDSPGQVPLGSSIVSATLEVNCINVGNTMKLYRLIEDWSEGTVTWNSPWTNPGADGPNSHADVALDGNCSALGWRTIDITQFVQEWSSGTQNYGIVLTDSGTDGVDFDTSESANPPVLRVSYQTQWQAYDTQPMLGTSATVTFSPVTLADQTSYVWNCLVTNAVGGESWAPADFDLTVDIHSPDAPVLIAPSDGALGVSTSPTLEVTVSDPDGGALDVTFYGRGGSGEEFTIVALPDTQKYALSYPEIFTAQTQWIADNAISGNIVFVTHEGDIVDTYNSTTEWQRANTSMSLLDGVVPYGIPPGNHDMDVATRATPYYDTYFYPARYESQGWYGGHYGSTNANSYQLFSAGGEDYIVVHLEFWPRTEVITWADSVLKAHANRKAIITTHGFLGANGSHYVHTIESTEYIWQGLVVPNDNVYFVLSGHVAGECARTDVVNGREVHQLLADYQDRTNGGNGWLRVMRFVPAEDKVYVETYSPWLNQYETDANSQFTLNFPMDGFSEIGSSSVSSNSVASMVWTDLPMNALHEWYVTVSDGYRTQTGPVWRFTTFSDDNTPPVISAVDAADITDTSARIIWTTDEPADSLVDYGPDTGYGWQASDGARVVSHSITLTDLAPNTTFHYCVTSRDSSNNPATSADYTFTTLPEPPPVSNYAASDYTTQIGSIAAGSYLDTHVEDDLAEALTEAILAEGKPANRHDELSHIWTFNVTGGNSVILYVDAFKTASPDGDNFVFAYSTDGIAYVDMLTITKTADDDTYQSYALPNSVEGIVYVRVRDTDRTAGRRSLDTVYIDCMYILCSGSVPDLPPSAPTGLTATAGDRQVQLDWDDNGEEDLDGYNVYRSEGGDYVKQNLSLLPASNYLDATVLNGTTYYYVVTAVDLAGQESAVSQEVSATPGAALLIHVQSILMSKTKSGKNWFAVATVAVLDEYNSPVEGAAVSYTWSGVHTGSGVASTDPDGIVTVTSAASKTAGATIFTVTGVLKAGCTYTGGSVTSGTITGP